MSLQEYKNILLLPQAVHIYLLETEGTTDQQQQLTDFWTRLGRMYVEGCDLNAPVESFVPSKLTNTLYPVPVNTCFPSLFSELTYTTYITDYPQIIDPKLRLRRINDFSVDYDLPVNEKQFVIDVNMPEHRCLLKHTIDDKCVLPVSFFLYLAWKTFAQLKNCHSVNEMLSIEMKNIVVHGMIQLVKCVLAVKINPYTGWFKVGYENGLVCEGQIQTQLEAPHVSNERRSNKLKEHGEQQTVGKEDVYAKLENMGYE